MFEITLDTLAVDAGAPELEQIESGQASPEVHVQVLGGQTLPFAPSGTGRPLRIPGVAVNFSLTKKAALELAELLKTQAETLPEEKQSSIVTASSLAEAEQAADLQRRITGG